VSGTQHAVIWDLDGTLVDSELLHWRAWREALRPEGVRLTRAEFLASFGQRNDTILRRWLGAGAGPERVRRVGEEKEAAFRRLVREHGVRAMPGALDWVGRLRDAGWRQAIASSAPRANVDAVVAALGLAPSLGAIVSAEDVSRGKPDPEVFLLAAERLGVPPPRCLVVEDAATGVAAARRAGMACLGVRPELEADLTVASLSELDPGAMTELVERPRPPLARGDAR
jgi:beta-phosphoglucomutase